MRLTGNDMPGVVLPDTEAWTVRDPLGREYPIWVALPAGYERDTHLRYPVLYVTDALYSFPLARSVRNMVGQGGAHLAPFILVGLPPQQGLSSQQSRSRDYTPTQPVRRTGDDYTDGITYGGAAHYRDFLADHVLPQVEARYRTDPAQRAFAGNSYGGLFGAYALLTRPAMFQRYILSSPSLWFDQHVINRIEADYADAHADLNARVLLSIGAHETPASDAPFAARNDMVAHTRSFAERLRGRGYPGLWLETRVVADEDHLTVYPVMLTRALLALFPSRSTAQAV
ncbi:alpha/beta hydrolase-fold protein [Stenotrophomonas sp.]|uniref:alpha/beta hydrolase n=1 Tax=Stenotrophomonas sp. TaxID=69392 RepID=UPI0025DF543C|nr:alpha/beta hydrolase-fold protein [Stenotrophomonas sp.]